MYTGFKVISQKKYYFDKNGVVVTGYTPLKNNTYYFSKSTVLGERGRALMNTWKTVNGKKYYYDVDVEIQNYGNGQGDYYWYKKTLSEAKKTHVFQ